jgi:hypothetical protein
MTEGKPQKKESGSPPPIDSGLPVMNRFFFGLVVV